MFVHYLEFYFYFSVWNSFFWKFMISTVSSLPSETSSAQCSPTANSNVFMAQAKNKFMYLNWKILKNTKIFSFMSMISSQYHSAVYWHNQCRMEHKRFFYLYNRLLVTILNFYKLEQEKFQALNPNCTRCYSLFLARSTMAITRNS